MQRFPFLDLYIRLARGLAGVLAVLGVVQAFKVWDLGFWAFLFTLVSALVTAFMVLVVADLFGCWKAIEANTRKSP
ncbi:MAG: hypothetical protein JNM25_06405 [Planctomycetes bacterium]|nr:hypothetical protein [Planctomycetota bacterium]